MGKSLTPGEDAPAAGHDSAAAAARAGARQLPSGEAPGGQPAAAPAALAASSGESSVMWVTVAAWRTLPQCTTGVYTALGAGHERQLSTHC